MAHYNAPLRDMMFVLQDVLGTDTIRALPGAADISDDLIEAVLGEGAKFCENVLLPLNSVGDQEGCIWDNGTVKTPTGFQNAYHQFVAGGWASLSADMNYGGQGLPDVIGLFMEEMVCSTNLSFGLYPGLTRGASILLNTHGSDDLKKTYLPKLVSGEWAGTMCLTESHCGTDLGLLRTRAVPNADGTYNVTGTKIFISSGEHDLTDNIIHFVIARTPGAPDGVRGISLFLVPKFHVHADGSMGDRNPVSCASIEHKMGIKGSSTCVMNFDGAVGYLVGTLNKGVAHMFTMMNSERLAVGNQGLGVGEIAYQNALAYARDRLQGRALTGTKNPDLPADPILVHPDVRRMVLTMKAYNEGNRMLAAFVALHLDRAHRLPDGPERVAADDFVQLMTPIVKAHLTDCGVEVANLGMQVFGGHGYIREHGMEQFARDARIAQIYEGTNGIQALDLVGRKIPTHTGRYLRQFFHPVQDYLERHKQTTGDLRALIDPYAKAFEKMQQITALVAQKGFSNPDEIGAVASDFLRLFAIIATGYLWIRAADGAQKKLAAGNGDPVFYQGKWDTAVFFMQKILPESATLSLRIMAGSKPVMAISDPGFGPF